MNIINLSKQQIFHFLFSVLLLLIIPAIAKPSISRGEYAAIVRAHVSNTGGGMVYAEGANGSFNSSLSEGGKSLSKASWQQNNTVEIFIQAKPDGGYNFDGWTELDDSSTPGNKGIESDGVWTFTTAYQVGDDPVVSQSQTNARVYDRYAHFSPIQYSLTYDANGGTVTPTSIPSYTVQSTDVLPTPTRAGYKFENWKVYVADGNWANGATFNAGTTIEGKYGNATLQAQWTAKPGFIIITITGLDAGNSETFTIKKGESTLYTVTTGSSISIANISNGTYTVTPGNWSWAYNIEPASINGTIPVNGSYTFSFTATKNTSAKKHAEKSNVNWKP